MARNIYKKTLLLLGLLVFGLLNTETSLAQSDVKNDFYKEIKNYNLSTVLMTKTFLAEDREDDKEVIKRAEPIGFIGDGYQRFYIHYTSVTQNPKNPYEYLVKGKTRVKTTICPFEGTITVKKAETFTNADSPNHIQGVATCDVLFHEDKTQTSTGTFKGNLKIGFIVGKNNKLRYNGLMFYADGFTNLPFEGTWTSYKTKGVKKCNWGDYRIPNSGDLDIGAGEFSANPKYFDKGWKNYILTQFGETEIDVDKGKKEEAKKWWE